MKVLFAVALTVSFGFVLNDIIDRKKDRLGHPGRVLPSGAMSVRVAWAYAVLLVGISALLSASLGSGPFLINLLAITLLTLYSPINNRYGLAANVIVGLVCAMILIFGIAASQFYSSFITAVAVPIFLFILGREIILDLRDVESDQSIGKASLPIVYGAGRALQIAVVLMIVSTIGFIGVGVLWQEWGYTVVVSMASILVWLGVALLYRNRDRNAIDKFLVFTRFAFASAVLALLV